MRRLPHPLPPELKKDRETGVVKAASAQEWIEWAFKSCAALFQQAPVAEKGAKAFLQGCSGASYDGSAGRTYAGDGTLPGPTPGQAARLNRERVLIEAYAKNLCELKAVLLRLALYHDSFAVLPHGKAQELAEQERGGKDCVECGRWVAQEGADWIRGGKCDACRKRVERATVGQLGREI